MKRTILFGMCIAAATTAFSQTDEANDTITTEVLPEVTVTADGQIEMANKTLLMPTQLEKKHSANGFALLEIMQTPELQVSPSDRSITTNTGGDVVLCINGMEVLPEDVASLDGKHIRNVEYIRTPSGKYAGKAALINFVTVKMDYGGNVYLSANEGFAYQFGDYLAFADFHKKSFTMSLTATGDWLRDHSYSEGDDQYVFSDCHTMERDYKDDGALQKKNGQAFRMRFTRMGENHRVNAYVGFTRRATPNSEATHTISYSTPSEMTERRVSSNSKAFAPSAYVNYTLWMPRNQTLDITASTSIGHNEYESTYAELQQSPLATTVTEDNLTVSGRANYSKSWDNNLTLVWAANDDYKNYEDTYEGSATGNQRLKTNIATIMAQLSKAAEKYYYYISAGVSDTYVSLNSTHYNYCVPIAFYGGNYAFSGKHSLSINGLFTHTLFEPSDKNSMIVPISFFETTCGNPDLEPMKVLSNTLSYNAQMGKSQVSFSYASNIYFDNIVHRYTATESTIFDTRINGGTFYGNMFTLSYGCSLLGKRLRLRATAIADHNVLNGQAYDMTRNIFRLKAGATGLIGDWMVSFDYATPYKTIDISQPWVLKRRPTYEWKARWTHKAFSAEALVRNPFSRYNKQSIEMDYGCYNKSLRKYDETRGRNISLTVIYRFSYGKESERGDMEVDKNVNNAIMKGY